MFERDEKCKKSLVGMVEGKKHLEDPDVDVNILLQHFLCLWLRESLIYINTCPTRCNKSSLFIILQVHSTCFGCQTHPSSGVHKTVTTASVTGHIFCAATLPQRGQVLTWPRWREVAAQKNMTSTGGCS